MKKMNLEYFKTKELTPLFEAIKEKYIKKSEIKGVVSVFITNDKEIKEIEMFLRNNKYLNIGVNKIKINDINKALEKSKYSEYNIYDILCFLYGDIVTKQNVIDRKNNKDNILLNEFINYFNNKFVINLVNENRKNIISMLNKDKELIYNIIKAIINLPSTPTLLNVFSANITKDPHYFDLDTKNSNLFLKYLAIYKGMKYTNTRVSKIELLNSVNIIIDNFSNTVLTLNIRGCDYLDILADRKEAVILNLNNINNLNNLYSLSKKILIVENPSILNDLIKLNTNIGVIVTNGNPNLAIYSLIDKLTNQELYYNGDFDPEGLLIADKLKERYPDLQLLFYDISYFKKSISDKVISDSRIKKLNNLKCSDLLVVKEEILRTKSVGYQEKLIDDIIKWSLKQKNEMMHKMVYNINGDGFFEDK